MTAARAGQAATLAELLDGWREELAEEPMYPDQHVVHATLSQVVEQVEAAVAAQDAQPAPELTCEWCAHPKLKHEVGHGRCFGRHADATACKCVSFSPAYEQPAAQPKPAPGLAAAMAALAAAMAELARECDDRADGMRDGAVKTMIGGHSSPAVAAWRAENDTWRECAALIRARAGLPS